MLPKDPYKLRLSGRGGQGILLAGVIISEAGMRDGLNVVQTQSYGPQARLGASKSEVVLSSDEIAFPEVDIPDLLLCLSSDAYTKYGETLADDGIRIVEKNVTLEENVENALVLPITDTAVDTGDIITANMVAVGVITALTDIVTRSSLETAMEERVKPDYLELNQEALKKGFEMGERSKKESA